MKTLFERVFAGNDEMYALAVKAVDEAIAKLGPDAPATFGDTAYSLPCLYAMTGKKVATVGEAKEALETTIKDFMTRNNRTKDIFTSGVATALSAEMIELMKLRCGHRPQRRDDRADEVGYPRRLPLRGARHGPLHRRPGS